MPESSAKEPDPTLELFRAIAKDAKGRYAKDVSAKSLDEIRATNRKIIGLIERQKSALENFKDEFDSSPGGQARLIELIVDQAALIFNLAGELEHLPVSEPRLNLLVQVNKLATVQHLTITNAGRMRQVEISN